MLVPLEIGTARRVTRAPRRQELVGRCGALLPLFRLVGVPCIATLWRVESLPRHRGDRPKLNSNSRDPFDLGRAQQNGSPGRIRTSDQPVNSRLRSEEHTSELQSLTNLVCRLLLEKKKDPQYAYNTEGRVSQRIR